MQYWRHFSHVASSTPRILFIEIDGGGYTLLACAGFRFKASRIRCTSFCGASNLTAESGDGVLTDEPKLYVGKTKLCSVQRESTVCWQSRRYDFSVGTTQAEESVHFTGTPPSEEVLVRVVRRIILLQILEERFYGVGDVWLWFQNKHH